MPQTREHVHVLELLGVTHMVVALTMCDLADAEMTELAELDVDDFLSGTVFARAPMVPVSSKTGEGIDRCWPRLTIRLVPAGVPAATVPSAPMPRRACRLTAALRSRAPAPS